MILNLQPAIALVASGFILVLGATGSALDFQLQLDRLLRRDVSYAKPGDQVHSLSKSEVRLPASVPEIR